MEETRRLQEFRTMLNVADEEQIAAAVEPIRRLMACYRCAMMEIETKFNVLNEQFSLSYERNPIESIKTRLKSFPSIREKLMRKGLEMSVEAMEHNLNDVAGVRVICAFIDDIYMLADCLLQQDDITLVEAKDYIKNPKENGYRSLHLIVEIPIFLSDEKKQVRVEVQLRTIAMESWANLEHRLRYKKDVSPDILRLTADELSECASISAELDRRMQSIRSIIEGS